MLRRITADIDSHNIFNLSFRLLRCYMLCPREITIKHSNSKGYHIILWLDLPKNTDKEYIFYLRQFIGDDKQRIKIDRKRKRPRQYLFFKKQRGKK